MRMFLRIGAVAILSVLGVTSVCGQGEFPEHAIIKQMDAALRAGDYQSAADSAKQLAKLDASDDVTLVAADTLLRTGESADAVKLFDKYLKARSFDGPRLWQRGIALYFNGDFAEGVKQFEVHRTVNPHDVENAAWHYLCLSKAESVQKANQNILPAPNDSRIPMTEVLSMLGTGDTKSVVTKIDSTDASSPQGKSARFYGYFYLGLYADANGKAQEALNWMKQSAKDAPRNYMGDVARVYQSHLEDELKKTK